MRVNVTSSAGWATSVGLWLRKNVAGIPLLEQSVDLAAEEVHIDWFGQDGKGTQRQRLGEKPVINGVGEQDAR